MFNAQQEINWYTILKKIIFDPGLTIENVLLEEGIKDINAVDLRGETILTTAIAHSVIGINTIEAIIKAGANINATIKHSTTIAEDENINTEHGKTALHCAVEADNPDLVQILLKQGAKVDAVDWYGRTGLHIAASHGHAEIAHALLKGGANANAKITKSLQGTPLHQAAAFASLGLPGVQEKAQETIKILLMYGADISSTDRRGEIPAVAAMDDDIGQFIEKAFNEVRSMKGEKIGTINGQDLSLYDFLKTDDKKQLLLYCSDRSIRNNIHKYLDKHSPTPNKRLIYCNPIIGQLHKGIRLYTYQDIITHFLKGGYTVQDEVTGEPKQVPSLAGIVEYIYPEISQHFTDTDVGSVNQNFKRAI